MVLCARCGERLVYRYALCPCGGGRPCTVCQGRGLVVVSNPCRCPEGPDPVFSLLSQPVCPN